MSHSMTHPMTHLMYRDKHMNKGLVVTAKYDNNDTVVTSLSIRVTYATVKYDKRCAILLIHFKMIKTTCLCLHIFFKKPNTFYWFVLIYNLNIILRMEWSCLEGIFVVLLFSRVIWKVHTYNTLSRYNYKTKIKFNIIKTDCIHILLIVCSKRHFQKKTARATEGVCARRHRVRRKYRG